MTSFELPADIDLTGSVPIAVTDDGKVECPDCSKRVTVIQSGALRSHVCADGTRTGTPSNATRTTTKRRKGKRGGKGSTVVPDNVLTFGSAVIASGVEWTATEYLSRAIPLDKARVSPVTQIDNSVEMVGPLIKLVWPQIPAAAQQFVSNLCDHEDLILCLLAWADYIKKLSAFQREAQTWVKQQQAQQADNVTIMKVGTNDGTTGETRSEASGVSYAGFEPFRPDASSV